MAPLFGQKSPPPDQAPPLRLTVISREGCHLCEAMLSDLRRHLANKLRRGEVVLEILDADADPKLFALYNERVPVLLANGEHVCDYRLDADALTPYLAAKLPPPGWQKR
jgi:hypothetical protein